MRTYQEAADLVVISPRTLRRGRCGELAIVTYRPLHRPHPQGISRCLDCNQMYSSNIGEA